MNADDHLETQRRWRTLQVRGKARVLQVFADYSPESWWWSRYLPSQDEKDQYPMQTAFLSRQGFGTQINLSIIECQPKFVLLHRRTVTSEVYYQIVTGFSGVHPIFVIPQPSEATRNPMMPLPDWYSMIRDARGGRCSLAVESRSGIQELRKMRVDPVLYLPPVYQLPPRFRREGKSPSDHFRMLICAESYPHLDILQAILSTDVVQFRGKPIRLILALGDGPGSVQETYRDGLLQAATELLGPDRVSVWEWTLREKFLRKISRDVDGILSVDPEGAINYEAAALRIPLFGIRDNQIEPRTVRDQSRHWADSRRLFWSRLFGDG